MYILLDPIILALPTHTRDYNTWFDFVDQLVQWSDAILVNKQYAKISSICVFTLMDTVPEISSPAKIKQYLFESEIEEFDSRDVFNAINRIFNNLPYFDDEMEIIFDWDSESGEILLDGELIWTQETIELMPELYAYHQHKDLGTAIRLTIGMIVYLMTVKKLESNFLVATKPFGVELPSNLDVTLKRDKQDETLQQLGEVSLNLISYPRHLTKIMDLENFWTDASLALDWGLAQHSTPNTTFYSSRQDDHYIVVKSDKVAKAHSQIAENDASSDDDDTSSSNSSDNNVQGDEEVSLENEKSEIALISFGDSFVQSIQDNHLDNKKGTLSIIFRNIASVITGQFKQNQIVSPPAKTKTNHHLTEGPDGPHRIDGDWTAWRLYVTRYEGDRIHYWWNENANHFHFASVGSHDNFDIPTVSIDK